MQHVNKKQKKNRPWLRKALLGASAGVLAASLAVYAMLSGAPKPEPQVHAPQNGTISAAENDTAIRVHATLQSGGTWTLALQNGAYVMEDEPDFPLDAYTVDEVIAAVTPVSYNEVIAESADDYAGRPAEFGLDDPLSVVRVDYANGKQLTLRIGAANQLETPFYYMTVDGDERLYALNTASAWALYQERRAFRSVEQPAIQKARLDSIRLIRPDGTLWWELQGSIKETDAIDRWMLKEPVCYAADGERMAKLQQNLENVRLGVYLCEATPENLTAYGFDEPRLIMELHMAAGALGTVNEDGVYDVQDYPEGDIRLVVGGAEDDLADWVLYNGSIYVASHFTYSPFMTMTAASTLSRYPVPTALGNLKALTVETDAGAVRYEITRTERVAENNDLVTDEDGNILCDVSVTRNGAPIRYERFEQAYEQLMLVTVSGTLDGEAPHTAPHTRYTFEEASGATHTIALADLDALHDAVTVDGLTMYYLIKGGFAFDVTE